MYNNQSFYQQYQQYQQYDDSNAGYRWTDRQTDNCYNFKFLGRIAAIASDSMVGLCVCL